MGHKLIRDEQRLTKREQLITADAAEAAVATVAFLLEEKVRRQGRQRLVLIDEIDSDAMISIIRKLAVVPQIHASAAIEAAIIGEPQKLIFTNDGKAKGKIDTAELLAANFVGK